MRHDTAVMILYEYILNAKQENGGRYYKEAFKQWSYSKWAAKEILELIKTYPDQDPISLVTYFKKNMRKLSRINKNAIMFLVAVDVAEDILDIFLASI